MMSRRAWLLPTAAAWLELDGEPRRIRSNFTNGLKSLPISLVPR